jgi:hypothetical protein
MIKLSEAREITPNGDRVNRITALALKRRKSVDFTGSWQWHVAE